MEQKTTILLTDDHQLLRAGLKLLLQRYAELEVIGEAADGEETLAFFSQRQPDLLLLDLSMAKMSGLECMKEVKSRYPKTKIIILSMHEDETYIKEAMLSGASAYVHKSAADTDLYKAISTVRNGGFYLAQKDSDIILHALIHAEKPVPDENEPFTLLSPRERDVLRLIVRGHSLSEVAEKLCLSIKTVDTYKVRIMGKIKANRKSDLVNYAIKYKMLTDADARESDFPTVRV